MITMPIKYRQVYGNSSYKGFTPFKDELGYHSERIIEIEPSNWNQGSMLIIRIIDHISPEDAKQFEKRMWELDIYDFLKGQIIEPNENQRIIISGLAKNEIMGKTAENMVHSLMIDLLFKNKDSGVDKFLPEVVEFWNNVLK
jgi:hypothetical protein